MQTIAKIAKVKRGIARRFRIAILRKSEEEIEYKDWLRAQDRDYTEKKKKGHLRTREELDEWWSEWNAEIEFPRYRYYRAMTSHWRAKAADKLVELPPYSERDGYWEGSDFSRHGLTLTDKGIAYVRAAVRQETLASSELFFRVVAVVIGASLVILSLISVLK